MNALAMAEVVQVVTPPRWSVTVTTPSVPEIVLDEVEETSDPSETLNVGALMDNAPAVSVKVMGVAAETGGAYSINPMTANAALNKQRNLVLISNPPTAAEVRAEAVIGLVASRSRPSNPVA